jgi:diguanylate cyclase (GGDEF)-like protein
MNASESSRYQRERLLAKLDGQLMLSRDEGERVGLLVFNLRSFGTINVNHGHAAGDRVLAMVDERIRAVLRPCDALFHIGNDEFAVLLVSLATPQVAELAAAKILRCIEADCALGSATLAVSAVAGGAIFPDHAADRDELLRGADAALQLAREQHREFVVYNPELAASKRQQVNLGLSLSKALSSNGLMLHYQPQIDLQRGELSGAEALLRWQHPEQGWIRPDIFIPVAEQSDLIDTLTYWSVNVALREWLQFCGGSPRTAISVSLSAKLLQSVEVVELIRQSLTIWGAPPEKLLLEVTESAVMSDRQTALQVLSQLHDMGVRLSIDDFGTGYSSLAYLQELPVNELKIDKSFVQSMVDRPQDRQIVRTIIDLAHNLKMCVVAEGIEDQRSLDMLRGMGCDCGQGFFIARPMPAGELPSWVQQAPWKKPAA